MLNVRATLLRLGQVIFSTITLVFFYTFHKYADITQLAWLAEVGFWAVWIVSFYLLYSCIRLYLQVIENLFGDFEGIVERLEEKWGGKEFTTSYSYLEKNKGGKKDE